MDIFNQRHEGFQMVYPLVNVYITMERSTMLLMGKSTISKAIFNCYDRSPEGKQGKTSTSGKLKSDWL
jgi:hypothetical protein